jgi:hypothetical protein
LEESGVGGGVRELRTESTEYRVQLPCGLLGELREERGERRLRLVKRDLKVR